MEEIRGKTLKEWKDYCKSDNVPIMTIKYITVLEERIEQLTIPVVSHQRELLSQYNAFVNMQYHGVSLDDSDIKDFNDWLNCG
jgi:hypothetical protein